MCVCVANNIYNLFILQKKWKKLDSKCLLWKINCTWTTKYVHFFTNLQLVYSPIHTINLLPFFSIFILSSYLLFQMSKSTTRQEVYFESLSSSFWYSSRIILFPCIIGFSFFFSIHSSVYIYKVNIYTKIWSRNNFRLSFWPN